MGCWTWLNRPEQALGYYRRALAIAPGIAELHINNGTALVALNRHQDALESFSAALAIDPERAEAHYNQSLVCLRLGDFENGWAQYEWRWEKFVGAGQGRFSAAPLWLGDEPLEDKTILLLAEQGLGDTIHFMRYVPMVAALGARVVLGVQSPLKALAATAAGCHAGGRRGRAAAATRFPLSIVEPATRFQNRSRRRAGNHLPYLRAPEERLTTWRGRVPANGRLRVGICWAGSATHLNDRNRSIALARFATLLTVPGLDFVSAQKETSEAERALLRASGVVQLGSDCTDFADAAAVLSQLDLLISVDTSVAHLAGAMGKAVALLLPFAPDFRWLLDRTDSPWYPTMRLYRQPAIGDWETPLGRLRQELSVVASKQR